jgi:ribosomal-protein-alanine N-acetyltransferase
MTEALRLGLWYAFRDLMLHRVEANIVPENAASVALARRCGLRREGYSPRLLRINGRWRDHERWALTVEDWRRSRNQLTRRRRGGIR